MSYLDIWFIDRRPRIKVFTCYLLIFIAFWIFSDFMIYAYTKSAYKPMTNYEINITSPEIEIKTFEASTVNGNIKGNIKNTTDEVIENSYLKFEFYTPRGVKSGTKYIKIDSLNIGEEKEFEFGFKFDNVESVNIDLIKESEENKISEAELRLDPINEPVGLLSKWIFEK